MKNIISSFVLFFALLLSVGCAEDGKKIDKEKAVDNIEKTADSFKDLIDLFSDKAKGLVEEGDLDRIKEAFEELDLNKEKFNSDSQVVKDKFEEMKNDPEIQRLMEKYKGQSKELINKLGDIFKEMEERQGESGK